MTLSIMHIKYLCNEPQIKDSLYVYVVGIPIFRIKVSVMETEWSGNMDPETGIPV